MIKRSFWMNVATAFALIIIAGFSLISSSIYATLTDTAFDSKWFLNWAIGQVPPIATFLIVLFYKDDRNTANAEYQEKEKDIREIVKNAGKPLNIFIDQFNRENKKKAYVAKINRKIMRRQYAKERGKRFERFKWIRKWREKINKYRDERIAVFNSRITPEYIEQNIDFVWFVHYDKITRSMIGTGVNLNRERKHIESVGAFYSRETIKKLLLSGGVQMVVASVVVTQILIGINGQFWFNLIMSLVTIFLQGFLGNRTADNGFERYRLHNQTNRISILKEYKEWKNEKNVLD